jgi:hypothetical protein
MKTKKISMYDLEPICIIVAKKNSEPPCEKETREAVVSLISDFRIVGTLNPLIHLFIGRWRPEINEDSEDRITRLLGNLKSMKGNSSVKVCYMWTNVLIQHELAWKDWRETF